MATGTRTSCKRCGRGSDMTCPVTDSLDELIEQLSHEGYEPHYNEIDEQMASSQLSVCTNCGDRGNFTSTGMKSQASYRAFWTCRTCSHWTEV